MNEDPEEIFRDFDEEALGEVPENASVNPVNTDLEVGAEFKFSIDPKATDDTEKTFLPQLPEQSAIYHSFLVKMNLLQIPLVLTPTMIMKKHSPKR